MYVSTQNGCSLAIFLIETESLITWANPKQNMAVMASHSPSPYSPSLAGCDEFSLGSGEWHVVLASAFPRIGATIHHENISRLGSAVVRIASSICICPTPPKVGVFVRITRVANCLIPSAAKIATCSAASLWLFPGNCTYLLSSEYAQARSVRVIVTRYPRLRTASR